MSDQISTPPESQGMPERPAGVTEEFEAWWNPIRDNMYFLTAEELPRATLSAKQGYFAGRAKLESLLSASREEAAGLKAKLDGCIFMYECSKCAWIGNEEHLGQTCRSCHQGTCIRLVISAATESHNVYFSNVYRKERERAETAEASLAAMRLELDKALSGNLQSTINVVEENVRLTQELAAMREAGEKVRADFLWPNETDSISEAGYEFANGKTADYTESWWETLIARVREQALREAAAILDKQIAGMVSEHGSYDGSTNSTELPDYIEDQVSRTESNRDAILALLPPQPRPDEEEKGE